MFSPATMPLGLRCLFSNLFLTKNDSNHNKSAEGRCASTETSEDAKKQLEYLTGGLQQLKNGFNSLAGHSVVASVLIIATLLNIVNAAPIDRDTTTTHVQYSTNSDIASPDNNKVDAILADSTPQSGIKFLATTTMSHSKNRVEAIMIVSILVTFILLGLVVFATWIRHKSTQPQQQQTQSAITSPPPTYSRAIEDPPDYIFIVSDSSAL